MILDIIVDILGLLLAILLVIGFFGVFLPHVFWGIFNLI